MVNFRNEEGEKRDDFKLLSHHILQSFGDSCKSAHAQCNAQAKCYIDIDMLTTLLVHI